MTRSSLPFSLPWALLSLILFFLGSTFLLFATWDLFRLGTIDFLLNEPFLQALIGISMLFFAMSIVTNIRKSKPTFILKLSPENSALPITGDQNSLVMEVSEKAAKKEVEGYFMTLFPGSTIQSTTQLFPNKIAIQAFLPKLPPEEQKNKVAEIENELPWHLARKMGWTRPITLSVYFDQ